jgi:DNA-binding response OmpR family regulator
MAPCRLRVLCYGHDEMLLYTRKQILDREFRAERCETLAGLTEALARGPLDLVLMCQSVPDQECQEVMDLSRAAWPEVKILVLQEGTHGACSMNSDVAMENLGGPPALLHEIHALLRMASSQNAAAQG